MSAFTVPSPRHVRGWEDLPTTDPGVAGRLWVNPANAYAVTLSQGPSGVDDGMMDFSEASQSGLLACMGVL